METIKTNLSNAVLSVKFKQYILGMDLNCRKLILNHSLIYLTEKAIDNETELLRKCIKWLQQKELITQERTQILFRKHESKANWDEFHTELIKCPELISLLEIIFKQ